MSALLSMRDKAAHAAHNGRDCLKNAASPPLECFSADGFSLFWVALKVANVA